MDPTEFQHRQDQAAREWRERRAARSAAWDAGLIRIGSADPLSPFAGWGDPRVCNSYLSAARELLANSRPRLRQVALPLLFLQRHALEVALKDAIEIVTYCTFAVNGIHGPLPEPLRTHNLTKLFRKLTSHSQLVPLHPVIAPLSALVELFAEKDKSGTYFRYKWDKELLEADLVKQQQELEQVFTLLFGQRGQSIVGLVEEHVQLLSAFDRQSIDDDEAA